MCLIGLKISAKGSLLIAANRDEYADRPTAAMHWWSEGILAGKDLKAGGTWLGVTKSGRFAAVTNVRDPLIKDNPVPRGFAWTAGKRISIESNLTAGFY